ncbi:sensor histidine kinase [Dyadobacter aurulentus]|uniref:sensor histidine kinase n=1 Tax=Dyadobacter sp. UC 10 TaxID=2605428 RepID=UPI0011F192BC|nr:histidine kinase [Dyadobacter sp. UC 10]KAA0990123.1 GHKL domain-containing protein [Dyadobacter sp. UC 10]
MNKPKDLQNHEFLVKAPVVVVAGLVSVPIWIAMDFFCNAMHFNNDEALATAITIFFMAAIFVGRYFAELLIIHVKDLRTLAIAIAIVLIASGIGLFAQLAFPFEGAAALHILLYWFPFLIGSISLGMLIKVVRTIGKRELQEARSQAAHSKSELHLLQSQLSPHFLFNTLNNLYGLSITQHEKIPPLLLKLADLLRYSVYDAGETFVPLKDELAYIENYIEFEKIRIGERLALVTDIENIADANIKIAPMLLIVFIENAFKHSKNTPDEKIFVNISLKTWNDLILFSVRNSYGKSEAENTILGKNSGFGLPNVTKRLELLYPNEHELTIKAEAADYQIALRLKAK